MPPGVDAEHASLGLKSCTELLGVQNVLPGELRRILYNQDLTTHLVRRVKNFRPDVVYERASLYATAGVAGARALTVPALVEVNAALALEQATYRATGLGDIAAQAERWVLRRADAVLAGSEARRGCV